MILFLGDSLTEGYRLAPHLAFPEQISQKLAAAGRPRRVINAGVAGHTTGDALRRMPLLLKPTGSATGSQELISDLVIELGVNDLLQRVPLQTVHANLVTIIQQARKANPQIRIFLFAVPALSLRFEFTAPEVDELRLDPPDEYARDFAAIFPDLAQTEELILLPFLLDGVLFRPEYNQPDMIHPNPQGQALVVENVWRALKDYL